jgi:site-specific DNA-methyltransferase (adenine-specific)
MRARTFSNQTSTIHHGDCTEILRTLADGSVDLIFADPPYNIGKSFGDFRDRWPSDVAYAEWCYGWLELCLAKLSPCGSMYVMSSTQAAPYLDLWLRERCTILSRIIWYYDSSGVQARRYFGSLYEPILFCVKDTKNYTFNADAIEVEARTGAVRKLIDYRKPVPAPYKSTKVPGNVWSIPRVRYRMPEYEEHPSQKPEALLERVIKASSNIGNLVLDPFAGTFTTSAVAQRLQRRSIGIEQNIEYIKIGLRRLGIAAQYNGQPLSPKDKSYSRRNGARIRESQILTRGRRGAEAQKGRDLTTENEP